MEFETLSFEEGQRGERGASQSDLYGIGGPTLESTVVVSKYSEDLWVGASRELKTDALNIVVLRNNPEKGLELQSLLARGFNKFLIEAKRRIHRRLSASNATAIGWPSR